MFNRIRIYILRKYYFMKFKINDYIKKINNEEEFIYD